MSGATVRRMGSARRSAAGRSPAEFVVPGEGVAEPVRQGEDPLPHGQPARDVVDEVGREIGRPPPAARRTEARPLHEKATRISCPHPSQRKRAKPRAMMPQEGSS